ncbi:TPA: hypothetical protein N0F65_002238 [Lagenidium giganteum]|uniref:Uncharacterized protein n=1 Tax=Lagenidium giganteum TaxID=4803 RepID=A0AAV2YYM2_9STRA|nr:TPA: hypothetical protein N0F65_002238 [Lagenidium giganteum]
MQKLTLRDSKNRPKGILETKSVNVDEGISRTLLTEKIIPAIKEKWPIGEKNRPIFIQQDNAPARVLVHDPEIHEAGREDGWNISLKAQPAQGPDLNILDLGFFASIRSLQSRTTPKTIDGLIAEVEKAFEEIKPAIAELHVLDTSDRDARRMANDGKNNFNPRHIKKKSLMPSGLLPRSLRCDADIAERARQKLHELRDIQRRPKRSQDVNGFEP